MTVATPTSKLACVSARLEDTATVETPPCSTIRSRGRDMIPTVFDGGSTVTRM